MLWIETQEWKSETHGFIKLQTHVLYCSWTQASNSNRTSLANLMKMVIHFAQTQIDKNGALCSTIWIKQCCTIHGHKPATVIAQAQLIWSKRWFILHKHRLIKTVHSVHADVGLGLSSSWIFHLSSSPVSDWCRSSLWISLVGVELSESTGVS